MRVSTLLSLLIIGGAACVTMNAAAEAAGVANANRAQMNYMLNCQGCHGPNAEGNESADVPRMKDFVGHFLAVPGGRQFLVQVPGSANASVSDAELAELLNWLLPRISPAQVPADFTPYTEREITALRYDPEEDVAGTRAKLVSAIDEQQAAIQSR